LKTENYGQFLLKYLFIHSCIKNHGAGSEEEGGLVTKLVIKLLTGCLPMYKKHIKLDVS
jgi:hypothetical protein